MSILIMRKKLFSISLALLLSSFICTAALAATNDDGFYIEEMPEFGQVDEVFFPSEETAAPVNDPPPSDPTPPAETQPAQTITPTETPTPEKEGGTPAPFSAQEPTPAPEPQPNRAASGLRDNLPVMIVVAVVALSALAAALVKKRKATKRPPEAKRPNDIGGRK